MAIAGALGPSLQNALIAIAAVTWPVYARLLRGQVLALKEREFVLAARTVGVPEWQIVFRHLLPNMLAPLLVQGSFDMGGAITAVAGLSFIGFGAQPPTPGVGCDDQRCAHLYGDRLVDGHVSGRGDHAGGRQLQPAWRWPARPARPAAARAVEVLQISRILLFVGHFSPGRAKNDLQKRRVPCCRRRKLAFMKAIEPASGLPKMYQRHLGHAG